MTPWYAAIRPMSTGGSSAYPGIVRLFVGMTPPEEAVAHAAGAVDRIIPPDMRGVPPERWHVTLAFLGDVDQDRLPELTQALDAVGRCHEPLRGLSLAGAGTFRGALWLGVSAAERHSPADRLARAVQRAMRSAGASVERRAWRAHLTVARWKPSDDLAHRVARSARDSLRDCAGPPFDIDRVTLGQSRLGPHPSYTALHVCTLATLPSPHPDEATAT